MAMGNKREKVNELNERLIRQLPDDIVLFSILPFLTIKELAKTRLVSRHWNRSWHHMHVLNFEHNIPSQESLKIEQEICSFVNQVNDVMGKHMGSTIDQFKVSFGLHNTYKSHIDTWLVWAFSKHVKKLELDFYSNRLCSEYSRYFLGQSLIKVKPQPHLTCLCLNNVDVTTQVVEQLLESSCFTLENLCIAFSAQLTSISVRNSLLSLKYFKVCGCVNLETVDISAPKLLSFTCHSLRFKLLRIANASSLSRVSIRMPKEDRLLHAIGFLFSYFSQLEYLKLEWYVLPGMPITVINRPPVMANVKHLELSVLGFADRSIAEWIPFIEAFPLLEKLTLQMQAISKANIKKFKPHIRPPKRVRHPFRCLKTLEIMGFVGDIELDIARYVLKKGFSLQEVIIGRKTSSSETPDFIKLLVHFLLKIPPSVKLTVI